MFANAAYFGNGVVGIEAASAYYFRKHSYELSIQDAALLASLISSPSYYSPKTHPDRALVRRNLVIDRMAQSGVIGAAEGEAAKRTPVLVAE